MLITILATIFVLGVLIFVHELGHFITAKAVDIAVPRFSIGLGPKMIGFRRGETEYVISWLPLGGYVKMAGMEEMEKLEGGPDEPAVSGTMTTDDTGLEVKEPRQAGPRDFESKSLPARALVISAGVIMNLLFAVVVYSASALAWGIPTIPSTTIGNVTEEYLPAGAEALAKLPVGTRIVAVNGEQVDDYRELGLSIAKVGNGPLVFEFQNVPPITVNIPPGDSAKASLVRAFDPFMSASTVIGRVTANSPAARAGLRANDRVLSAGGKTLENWQQFVAEVETNPGRPVPLSVQRGDEIVAITVIPEVKDLRGTTYGRVGVNAKESARSSSPRVTTGLGGAIAYGFSETWQVVAMTADFVRDLFTGNASPRAVGGPLQIGQISGQLVRAGLEDFLSFMALFSVNLAVLNLLPIPVLDGGHLMFLAVEAVRGRALSLEQRIRLSQVGFVIVVLIMIWALTNDVLRVFGL